MKSEAEQLFDKVMEAVPEEHRVLSFEQARRAAQKKTVLMTREPVQKIIRDEPDVYDTFEDAVTAIRKTESCSGTEAMSRAARHHPDLLRKYNSEGLVRCAREPGKSVAKAQYSEAKQKFDLIVGGIAERERVPRHVAMGRARRRHPMEFELAYPQK